MGAAADRPRRMGDDNRPLRAVCEAVGLIRTTCHWRSHIARQPFPLPVGDRLAAFHSADRQDLWPCARHVVATGDGGGRAHVSTAVEGAASSAAACGAMRRACSSACSASGSSGACRWLEVKDVLTELADTLRASRPAPTVEIDDGWHADRDLTLRVGGWGRLNVRALIEEHAQGACLLRVGVQLRLTLWRRDQDARPGCGIGGVPPVPRSCFARRRSAKS